MASPLANDFASLWQNLLTGEDAGVARYYSHSVKMRWSQLDWKKVCQSNVWINKEIYIYGIISGGYTYKTLSWIPQKTSSDCWLLQHFWSKDDLKQNFWNSHTSNPKFIKEKNISEQMEFHTKVKYFSNTDHWGASINKPPYPPTCLLQPRISPGEVTAT